jgi:hypothetical protein
MEERKKDEHCLKFSLTSRTPYKGRIAAEATDPVDRVPRLGRTTFVAVMQATDPWKCDDLSTGVALRLVAEQLGDAAMAGPQSSRSSSLLGQRVSVVIRRTTRRNCQGPLNT